MSSRYHHLLSPIRAGNIILKNRLIASNAMPHFLMGPEPFLADPVIAHYTSLARNGAAIVTVDAMDDNTRDAGIPDIMRFPNLDLGDPSTHNYLSQLSDAIHCYGALASIAANFRGMPPGFDIVDRAARPFDPGNPAAAFFGEDQPARQISPEQLYELIPGFVERLKLFRRCGYDMCCIHMSYQAGILGKLLSPLSNTRTDELGGSLENRARFPLELCRAVKAELGQDFLIEVQVSGEEAPGGITVADTVAFAHLAQGLIDILQIRAGDASASHPTAFNSEPGQYLTLRAAEAVKRSGAKVLVAPIGGFQNLDDMEEALYSGKADLIATARAFLADPDFYQKALEGRGEDVVPCIRCNRCHVASYQGPWTSVCSVNPRLGLEHSLHRMFPAVTAPKRVAVVGGGPAGMRAALFARARGHQVTLYERGNALGGQLKLAGVPAFKWPVRDLNRYLIRQVYQNGVNVLLNTPAVPDQIRSGGYDAVLVAVGAAPVTPPLEGVDAPEVWNALDVYGHEHEIGPRVVVVGGSETGSELGMHLAQLGHDVTVLTRRDRLADDATPIHYHEIMEETWNRLDRFRFLTRATTLRVGRQVVYRDAAGTEHTLDCDTAVVCGGMRPLQEEAMAFVGTADRVLFIGDCKTVGNLQTCARSAFGAAMQL